MVKEILVVVKGKPTYERWTIYQWLLNNKDFLENKYNVVIKVEVREGDNKYPCIIVGKYIIEEPPFEEGYVLEVVDSILSRILNKN